MSDPKRWGEAGSDVDPVVRSVLRYAKGLGPERVQVQRLLRRLETARDARRVSRRRGLVARRVWLAAAFLVMLSGVAFAGVWAGYSLRSLQREWSGGAPEGSAADARRAGTGKIAHRPNATTGSLSGEPKGVDGASASEPKGVDGAFASEPKGVDGALAGEPKAPDRALASKSRTENRSVTTVSRSTATARAWQTEAPVAAQSSVPASSPGDAELLQAARAAVVADPNRALTLTAEHASGFPGSPLTEERTALRIEALARLGRSADAARELGQLELRYPRSPYRQRLRALITP